MQKRLIKKKVCAIIGQILDLANYKRLNFGAHFNFERGELTIFVQYKTVRIYHYQTTFDPNTDDILTELDQVYKNLVEFNTVRHAEQN